MRTVINKIVFGVVFMFVLWKGLDGLIINVFYSSTDYYDILQLEQSNKIESRNLEITNGIVYKKDFFYYEENQFSTVDVVYPLLSSQQLEKYHNSELIKIKVLVRLNNQNRSCLTTKSCIPDDSVSIKGFVKIGLDNLRSSDFETLESELVKIDENVILIEPSKEAIKWYWNLMMFIGGIIFSWTILKSFFRKATSLEEYWQKITETNES